MIYMLLFKFCINLTIGKPDVSEYRYTQFPFHKQLNFASSLYLFINHTNKRKPITYNLSFNQPTLPHRQFNAYIHAFECFA